MQTTQDGDVSVTPETGPVWTVAFTTSPEVIGWVIQSGRFYKAISSELGDLGQQMDLMRAARLVAAS